MGFFNNDGTNQQLSDTMSLLQKIPLSVSKSGNLIDYSNLTDGKDFDTASQTYTNDSGVALTDFFPVSGISALQTNLNYYGPYYFDENKNYISKGLSVPSNAIYGRLGILKDASGLLWANKTGVLSDSTIFSPTLATKYEIDQPITNETIRASIPSTIPVVEGQRLELFWDSVFNVININNYRINVDSYSDTPFGNYYQRKMYLDTDSSSPRTQTTNVKLINKDGNSVSDINLNFTVTAPVNPSTIKNLLIIGDSTTSRDDGGGVASTIYDLLAAKGMTNVHLIGTQHPSTRPEVSHEGYDGWNIEYFINPSQPGNPFSFGGVVDFAQYCSANGYSGIDYVIMHLSWHPDDENGGNAPDLVQKHDALSQLIEAAYPNVKIFWTGLPAYNYHRYFGFRNVWKTIGFDIDEAYQASTNTKNNRDTIWPLPQVDCEYNLNYLENQPVNSRNSVDKERILSDQVHGGDAEYQQVADAMFRKLVTQIAIDVGS